MKRMMRKTVNRLKKKDVEKFNKYILSISLDNKISR